jgi:hypothetical protein
MHYKSPLIFFALKNVFVAQNRKKHKIAQKHKKAGQKTHRQHHGTTTTTRPFQLILAINVTPPLIFQRKFKSYYFTFIYQTLA